MAIDGKPRPSALVNRRLLGIPRSILGPKQPQHQRASNCRTQDQYSGALSAMSNTKWIAYNCTYEYSIFNRWTCLV